MHIAFVRPGMSGRRSRDALQPLVFALIKALTPADVELTFIDGLLDPVPLDLDVDALALSVDTFSARAAYALADAYRARGVRVVMGGYHPSAVPDEAAQHADAVVIGEAEDTWPCVVADLRSDALRPVYRSTGTAPLDVTGDLSAFDAARYPKLGLVQFGRGCRYACEFCSIHAFHGATIRTRPVDAVVAEIIARPEKLLFFVDDNLFADRERAVELFERLVGSGKRWVCQISMDVADDPALLDLLRRAGCIMVLIGFESLDAANLKQMGKGANLHARYAQVLDRLDRAGLMVYGTFVIGYDHDTAATAGDLRRFAEASGFSIANFNPLMAMPGTRLYHRLVAEGRLRHDTWWLDPDFRYGDAMVTPAGMTDAELTASCRAARFGFYSPTSILRRGLRGANRRHVGVHLLANAISAIEVRGKQGRGLGAS